jgi:integrase/recombinase XerD
VKIYTEHAARFARHFDRPLEELGPEEIRDYQLYLIDVKRASWSQFNQAVCALRFLYRTTLPRPWPVSHLPYGQRRKPLPTVLGVEEVSRLLACVASPSHRMLIETLYATGLRVSEVACLRVADIDGVRSELRVTHGKGGKQRLVPLSPRLLLALRAYWRLTRPTDYLFPGHAPGVPLSVSAIQKAVKSAATRAGLSKRVTPHTLRHSYATGLLEAGVDLVTIGRLLGHKDVSTTLVYLHVRRPNLGPAPRASDWLPVRSRGPESAPSG